MSLVSFKANDDPVELSGTGRPKRKGRQDISYKLFFSENEDDEELQDFLKKRDDRLVTLLHGPLYLNKN